ncbi:MAG: DUF4864 domain-containing protein [Hyphomicrobiales bacterium]
MRKTVKKHLLAAALILGSISGAYAEGVTPADQTAIQTIIQNQVDAFLANNSATAYSYAAPSIKRMFQNDKHFMSMVEQQYQPVFRPQSFAFGRIADKGNGPVQEVYITGPAGKDWVAVYTLEKQSDGSWKINGCFLQPDTGAKV